MGKKTLVIFSDSYPNGNSETFLHNEMFYLAPCFENIIIFPQNKGIVRTDLPENVTVVQPMFSGYTEVRKILKMHFFSIIRIFLYEIWHSPHRLKYITSFRSHLIRLISYISQVKDIKPILDTYKDNETVFYSYWFNEWGTRLSLYKFLFRKKFKFMARIHLYDFEEEFNSNNHILFRLFDNKMITKIVAISNYGKRYFETKYNKSTPKVYLSYLGVKSSATHNKFNKKIIIASCSNLEFYKRPLLLAKLISKFNLYLEWHHFGDGSFKEQFIEVTKKLPNNINFKLHGNISNSDILDFYKKNAITIFINTSIFEGIPVALMEAISYGIPVVGCNICGVPEIVNSQTGILLDKNFDVLAAAGKIENFLSQPEEEMKLFRTGVKKFWEEQFNADINYPSFIKQHLLDN